MPHKHTSTHTHINQTFMYIRWQAWVMHIFFGGEGGGGDGGGGGVEKEEGWGNIYSINFMRFMSWDFRHLNSFFSLSLFCFFCWINYYSLHWHQAKLDKWIFGWTNRGRITYCISNEPDTGT